MQVEEETGIVYFESHRSKRGYMKKGYDGRGWTVLLPLVRVQHKLKKYMTV